MYNKVVLYNILLLNPEVEHYIPVIRNVFQGSHSS